MTRILVLNPAVVQQELDDFLRKVQTSLDEEEFEVPATWRARLACELCARAVWPPLLRNRTERSVWFRLLGFGLSVHLPGSVVNERICRYGLAFHSFGPIRWRILAPDLLDLGGAVNYVRKGTLT